MALVPASFSARTSNIAASFSFYRLSSHRISCCSAAASPSSEAWDSLTSKQPTQIESRKAKRLQVAGVDQEQLVDPRLLADPDSRFSEIYGVQVHYKLADPDSTLETKTSQASSSMTVTYSFPAILLHGFGASLFSWERVMKPLANCLGAPALAFDRPAFGLTTRTKLQKETPNPYTVDFSAAATLSFMDCLKWRKSVLVGHSAGCIVAVDAYLKAPERIAAMIMVAPALVAPLLVSKKSQESTDQINPLPESVRKVWQLVISKLAAVFKAVGRFFRLIWYRTLAAILRSKFGHWLVEVMMDKFGLQGVRMAWYSKEKVDDYVISGYTKPLKCKDWKHGLLEYCIAMTGEAPFAEQLQDIKCPVLIITGDSDAIVPAWNAKRLSKALPNAECYVIKECGHLPHEEKPEEFLKSIQTFIQKVQLGMDSSSTSSSESVAFMGA